MGTEGTIGRNCADRSKAESSLPESEARFQELADNISQFAWTADERGWIYWYNKRWYDYTGATLEEMQGWGWQKVHHPDHVDRVVERIRQSFVNGTPWEDTFPLRGRDGSYRWFLSRALPIRNEAGEVVRWFGTNTDVTEQIEAESALRESEVRFRELADNISQFAWTADEAGWIYWYNKRWLDYTGRTLEDMQGWGWQKVHHPDHVDRVVHRIRQSFESGTPWEDTFPLRGRDGGYRWFLSRALPIRNEAGDVVRWFGTNTDVTEQIELQKALREISDDLRQRSIDLQATRDRAVLTAKATTGFLATVSHDVRQPLQAMALQLGVLRNEVSTPEGKRQLLALERSLGSAMELLDFLLEYIKLDAGALEPRVTTVGIGSLLEGLSDTFAVVAAQKGIRLTLLPTTLGTRSDAQLLARILRNFVSNAVKYTDRGGVLVGCRRRGDNVRIEVWDTGCGIPTEHQRQIFWEFVQLREAGRQHGGLGLGLAIVDRLSKLLGHRIEVRSRPGRGSVFAVEVPLVSAAIAAPPAAVSPEESSEPLASKLIALIDDDVHVSKAMASLLRTWGATAVCASSREELLRALSGRKPDAVIADRNLGRGGDGFEVLSDLEKELGGALPSLILTGEYDLSGQQQANSAGRRILHKPVWGDALLAALCFELSRSGALAKT